MDTKQSKVGHTKGPWVLGNEIVGSKRIFIEKANSNGLDKLAICEMITPRKEWQANAHLISAAPELLEACKFAITHWTSEGKEAIQQVIAKAEGRT